MRAVTFFLIPAYVFAMKIGGLNTERQHSLGAMFGTIMAFNVWFRIWPAQQNIITAIKNGEAPDANL